MKRIKSIILCAVFLLGSSNMSLGLHYCHDELASIGVNELNSCQEESDDNCGDESSISASMECCSDLMIDYDLDEIVKLHTQGTIVFLSVLHFSDLLVSDLDEDLSAPVYSHSPPPKHSLFKEYCSLIFYG